MVGSAQLREEGALLQHGSMLLEDDQSLVRELTGDGHQATGEITLRMAVGREVSFAEAAEAVREAAGSWMPGLIPITDAGAILRVAESHESRFKADDWTWSR